MSEPASSETVTSRPLVVRSVFRTDVGLVRTENQDFGGCTTPQEERRRHDSGRLLIVADGMGGHRGGATASRLATETVKASYLQSAADPPTALRESLVAANSRIFHEAQSNPELRGMGTTTTVLAVSNGLGWIGHVGDSRAYLIRDGAISQLTADHSLVATMMREGLLTPQEAETHPRRNVLQRSMGVALDVDVDVEGPYELRLGDTFVLCSDGLHGVVKEEEIRHTASQDDIDAAADELVSKALDRGAPDNVTVIVARVVIADEAAGDALDAERDEAAAQAAADSLQVDPQISPFDETQPLGALIAPRQGERSANEGAQTVPVAGDSPASREAARGGASLLKWILIAVLILGAAATWLYQSSGAGPSASSHSSSR